MQSIIKAPRLAAETRNQLPYMPDLESKRPQFPDRVQKIIDAQNARQSELESKVSVK